MKTRIMRRPGYRPSRGGTYGKVERRPRIPEQSEGVATPAARHSLFPAKSGISACESSSAAQQGQQAETAEQGGGRLGDRQ